MIKELKIINAFQEKISNDSLQIYMHEYYPQADLRFGLYYESRVEGPTCCLLLGMWGSMVDTWNMSS